MLCLFCCKFEFIKWNMCCNQVFPSVSRCVFCVEGRRWAGDFLRVMHLYKRHLCRLLLFRSCMQPFASILQMQKCKRLKLPFHNLSFSALTLLRLLSATQISLQDLFCLKIYEQIHSLFLCFRSSWATCIVNTVFLFLINTPEGETFI